MKRKYILLIPILLLLAAGIGSGLYLFGGGEEYLYVELEKDGVLTPFLYRLSDEYGPVQVKESFTEKYDSGDVLRVIGSAPAETAPARMTVYAARKTGHMDPDAVRDAGGLLLVTVEDLYVYEVHGRPVWAEMESWLEENASVWLCIRLETEHGENLMLYSLEDGTGPVSISAGEGFVSGELVSMLYTGIMETWPGQVHYGKIWSVGQMTRAEAAAMESWPAIEETFASLEEMGWGVPVWEE